MKKATSFKVGIVSLLTIYGATLIVAPDSIGTIGPAVVAGIVGACGFFQSANVADNWQRSKYYKTDLDRKEQ
jgi:hypothetical protein